MTAEDHRQWRERLGAFALGQLDEVERAETEMHLRTCEECRREADSLGGMAALLDMVEPANLADPAPQPPAELAGRVFDQIGAERRGRRRRRKRIQFGFGFGFATAAAAAAVLAFVVLAPSPSGNEGSIQELAFQSVPKGVSIAAELEPGPTGTQIYMRVAGIRSGTLCRVFVRRQGGGSVPAGSFRYRYGGDASPASLSTGLDLSQARAIVVKAGSRTFVQAVT